MAPNERRESGAKKATSAKQARAARIVYSRVCPKFQFQKNFNLQLAFFKPFYVSSSGSSSLPRRPLHGSSHSTRAPDNKNPDGRTEGGQNGRDADDDGGGDPDLWRRHKKTLSWPAGRPTDSGLRRVLRRITRFIQSRASEFRPKIMKSPSNSVTDSILHYCVKSPDSSKPISVGHGAPCTPTRRARAQSRVRRKREREREVTIELKMLSDEIRFRPASYESDRTCSKVM